MKQEQDIAVESHNLGVTILPQPNDVTCGPTSLHAVYSYYGDNISLGQVTKEVKQLQNGGTLGVLLANHALRRGYKATIYSYNLHMFDPSWAGLESEAMLAKLGEQMVHKKSRKFQFASKAYMEFLKLGGIIQFEVLTANLLRKLLRDGTPVLTGLSATWLYQSQREIGETNTYDDVKGEPSGHFVVLSGYETNSKQVRVADPLSSNPINQASQYYDVDINRLINAILLGIVTYDANLLIVQQKES